MKSPKMRSTNSLRSVFKRRSVCVAVVAALVISACGSDEPELTVEERLEQIAGEALLPNEIASQLETADSLCQLDEQLLFRLWVKLDDQQFAFQEFVFNERCPDRSDLIENFVRPPTPVTTSTTSTPSAPTSTMKSSSSTASSRSSEPNESFGSASVDE